MFLKYNNTNISLFSIHIYHSSKLACFKMCKMIGGNCKTIDFGNLVKCIMDSFFSNDLLLGSDETSLLEASASERSHHRYLRVSFLLNLNENITFFFNIKTVEWELKIWLFNYWNDLALSSVEKYFLEVGAYVSLKRATAGIWENPFCWIWMKRSHFFKYKKEEWHLNSWLFNYWNDLALGSFETYIFEVGAYMSLKGASTGVWKGRFHWIWVKIPQFF